MIMTSPLKPVVVIAWAVAAVLLCIFEGAVATSATSSTSTHTSSDSSSDNLKDDLMKTNLLFIMYDDLRPDLSVYGRDFMITPNFERLAKKSVSFNYAFNQVAVCLPSRNSMLTGIRPDTLGIYDFQKGDTTMSYNNIPRYLVNRGYKTAGYGKIFHWENDDRSIWSLEHWDNNWYDYQAKEGSFMNSSTMPDKIKKLDEYRDWGYTMKAIDGIRKLASKPNDPFMVGLGFKLPHLAYHIPYEYYEMYKNKTEAWRLSKKELRYPHTSPAVAHRGSSGDLGGVFRYMNKEGALPSVKNVVLGDINMVITERMHDELMFGYCGGISYLDMLLGKLLDVMDELDLWKTTTVILTADHGFHNGEKGIIEKWTLFDESTRVPLLIHHPQSPFKGKQYPLPVELIDIFPTIKDMIYPPRSKKEEDKEKDCPNGGKCLDLQGKSLAPVVLGKLWENEMAWKKKNRMKYQVPKISAKSSFGMPYLSKDFAISQIWRQASKELIHQDIKYRESISQSQHVQRSTNIWEQSCQWRHDRPKAANDKNVCLMGYSMRSQNYRYNAWLHFNWVTMKPNLDEQPFEEELYDHRNEVLSNFTHMELHNLAHSQNPIIKNILLGQRHTLLAFIKKEIIPTMTM